MKKLNVYKLISRFVMALFIMLTTVQVLLDMELKFGLDIQLNIYIATLITSLLPISFLVIVMNLINRKTKYADLFMIPEIKFVVKMLLYLSIFAVFTLWSTLLVSFMGYYYDNTISFNIFTSFLMSRIIYSVIYSTIIIFFLYGFSGLNIKSKKEKNEIQ